MQATETPLHFGTGMTPLIEEGCHRADCWVDDARIHRLLVSGVRSHQPVSGCHTTSPRRSGGSISMISSGPSCSVPVEAGFHEAGLVGEHDELDAVP